ncbi:uncharacterized protein H6S33_008123 [Morchella sextelata]|uniref:uncharacterized protein n=1 Tax=Morchella sextelata TaxID=1174677 RepID=UPI001D04720B|nr:uncharacterized protein H6S33_008123 [Morchella sextelata]KAH0603119.1 hypothetical protein H6S33_008123 [Morchella sextelata]
MYQFLHLPVELIRMIAKNLDPEDVAALSMCSTFLHDIAAEYTPPEISAYVTICTLDIALVQRTIETATRETIKLALKYEGSNSYALGIVAKAERMDLFILLYPFVCRWHKSLLCALNSAISVSHRAMITLLLSHIDADQLANGVLFACVWSPSEFVRWFISQLPTRWRAYACTAAMETVVKLGEIELLEILIAGGGDPSTLLDHRRRCDNIQSGTILHFLAYWGLTNNEPERALQPMIRMLCEAGTNVNATDRDGRTALHILARIGSFSVEQHLESLNMVPNTRIDLIYEDIIRTLIEFGADLGVEDMYGMTAYDYADKYDEQVMTGILIEHCDHVLDEREAIEDLERAMAALSLE